MDLAVVCISQAKRVAVGVLASLPLDLQASAISYLATSHELSWGHKGP